MPLKGILFTCLTLALTSFASTTDSYSALQREFDSGRLPNISDVLGMWSINCFNNESLSSTTELAIFKMINTTMPDGTKYAYLSFGMFFAEGDQSVDFNNLLPEQIDSFWNHTDLKNLAASVAMNSIFSKPAFYYGVISFQARMSGDQIVVKATTDYVKNPFFPGSKFTLYCKQSKKIL